MREACAQAALATDLAAKNLPAGLDTLVGERGVTLSGGQQMRVALARAFYQKPDLIVCDDPLAAVDLAVGQQLFRSLHSYASAGKSVILAMNQLHLMQQCSRIIHFDAGSCVAQGGFSEVSAAAPTFFSKPEELSTEHSAEEDGGDTKVVAEDGAATAVTVVIGHDPETRLVGSVSNSITKKYLQSFGWPLFILCLVTGHVSYALMGFNDRWLASWVEASQDIDDLDSDMYIAVYIGGTVMFLLFLLISSAFVQMGAAKASRTLHADCVESIMRAPVEYFENTPSGRLISRFSSDVTISDTNLAQFGDNFIQFTATLVCLIVVVVMIIPLMSIAAVLVSIGTYLQVIAVDRSNREVKRMAVSLTDHRSQFTVSRKVG